MSKRVTLPQVVVGQYDCSDSEDKALTKVRVKDDIAKLTRSQLRRSNSDLDMDGALFPMDDVDSKPMPKTKRTDVQCVHGGDDEHSSDDDLEPEGARSPGRRQSLFLDENGMLKTLIDRRGTDGKIRRVTAASVLGLDHFKQLYAADMAKLTNSNHSSARNSICSQQSDHSDDLPPSPRFAATLSPAGQLAYFKCLEDKLHQNMSPECSPLLQRKKTPKVRLTLDTEENNGLQESLSVDQDKSPRLRRRSLHLEKGMTLLDSLKDLHCDSDHEVYVTKRHRRPSKEERKLAKSVDEWEHNWRQEFDNN